MADLGDLMRVKVNGEWGEYPDAITLDALLNQLQTRRDWMAVERNKKVVRKTLFAETRLEDGDELEIIKLVGGG
ncbi:MAG: sulfur carrier protein ThiS [Myxococcales bacterium]|nr:MAG: sulfur carrier protein ThiS [Myxococcales bacterium]